ncbi:unnamed protein product [Paramecium pentaurelia]|uniref:Transmembrane protein n=1 Tax=Paramecium pentaurelia TaxID=43138 RepID=A0A8S1XLS0_9CILI|nr:unnamed protein product [Paramecium pentaurelia]
MDFIQISILSIIVILYGGIMLSIFNYQIKFKFSVIRMNNNQKFQILHLFRQVFFLYFLIFTQNSQIIQLGLLLLKSIFQIKSIYHYRDIYRKSNFIVQMVVEISIFIFMFSSLLYIQEFDSFFYEEKKILLGWIQMAILSLGIIIQLIIILQRLFRQLRSKCQRPIQTQNQVIN